eukprot:GHVU01081018.1.p1 GENE.GHVU01081018.1~~GHVU01081018.1.p1  ORF type:complete len:326 (-),score=78.31 GHVU01081018.1:1104-2081(-)
MGCIESSDEAVAGSSGHPAPGDVPRAVHSDDPEAYRGVPLLKPPKENEVELYLKNYEKHFQGEGPPLYDGPEYSEWKRLQHVCFRLICVPRCRVVTDGGSRYHGLSAFVEVRPAGHPDTMTTKKTEKIYILGESFEIGTQQQHLDNNMQEQQQPETNAVDPVEEAAAAAAGGKNGSKEFELLVEQHQQQQQEKLEEEAEAIRHEAEEQRRRERAVEEGKDPAELDIHQFIERRKRKMWRYPNDWVFKSMEFEIRAVNCAIVGKDRSRKDAPPFMFPEREFKDDDFRVRGWPNFMYEQELAVCVCVCVMVSSVHRRPTITSRRRGV